MFGHNWGHEVIFKLQNLLTFSWMIFYFFCLKRPVSRQCLMHREKKKKKHKYTLRVSFAHVGFALIVYTIYKTYLCNIYTHTFIEYSLVCLIHHTTVSPFYTIIPQELINLHIYQHFHVKIKFKIQYFMKDIFFFLSISKLKIHFKLLSIYFYILFLIKTLK